MFKGIVAKQQAQVEAASNIKGVSFETFMNALDAADARVSDYEQETTLENARNLRNALEQFGGTPDGYRALMAFADADGSLASAFGVKSGAALESLSDTDVMMDVQTLTTGLESYIVGEETPSTEGLREILHRNKKALTVLYGIAMVASTTLTFGAPKAGLSAAATAAFGGTLYAIDRLVNKGRVDGSVEIVDGLIERVRSSLNIIRIAGDAVYGSDLSRMAEAASGVAGKIKGDLEKIGCELVEGRDGNQKIKTISRQAYRGPIPKMIPFNESGWTPEKLKAALAETSKLGVEVGTVCKAVERKLTDTFGEDGEGAAKEAEFIYDALDIASGEASYNLRIAIRSLKSAKKFFTDKKEGEDTKPAEGGEGDKK